MAPFVPRQRKHKRQHRTGHKTVDLGSYLNPTEIVPALRKEREEKKILQGDANSAEQPKILSKKQRKLDKYIVQLQFHVLRHHMY